MLWLAQELPPDIPVVCVMQAAEHYDVPVELMAAVVKQEGGKVGQAYPRSHGTYFGPYQISDKWLDRFAPWGYTADVLTNDPCANAAAGAYILAFYKIRTGNWPDAIARYNVGSIDTPERIEAGTRYTNKVLAHWWAIYKKWNR